MTVRRVRRVAALGLLAVTLSAGSGCTGNRCHTTGTLVGAGSGALIGAAAYERNRLVGAAAGAVVGGIAGFLIAKALCPIEVHDIPYGARATGRQRSSPESRKAKEQYDRGVATMREARVAQVRGDDAEARRKLEEADKELDASIEAGSAENCPDPAPYVQKGYIELAEGEDAEAERNFRAALAIDERNPRALAGLRAMGKRV